MEKTEKLSSHQDRDDALKLLADVAVQMGPIDAKQTSGHRPFPVYRSGRCISVTWKVKENLGSKPAFDKNSDPRPSLESKSSRPISVTRKAKENCGSNAVLDNNVYSQEMVAMAQILVEMLNKKNEARIWSSFKEKRKDAAINLETTDRNLDEAKQLNENKCISEITAQGSSRKRKLPSGEIPAKDRKKLKGEPHVCEICGKSFATGVQLGRHKRAHYHKEPAESEKCCSIRKCADSELRFYLTMGKNDKRVSFKNSDI